MNIVKNTNKKELQKIKCQDIFDYSCGNTPKKELNNYKGTVPWVNISDLGEKYITSTKKTINDESKIVEANSLLISFKLSVGVCSINKIPVSSNEAIIRIEPSKLKKNISIESLYYLLPKAFIKNCGKNGIGANVLTTDIIKNIELTIPNELEKITNLLKNYENKIDKIKNLLEKIEMRNQYYADNLLNYNLTIEDNIITSSINNINNKKIKITDYIEIINGHPFKSNEMKNEGKYAVIKMSNFKETKVSTLKNTVYTNNFINKAQLMKNDLLIGLSGSVGEYAIFNLDEICLLNQRCIILRNKNDDIGDYVKTYIINKVIQDLKNSGEGGVIKNVSSNFFQDMEIGLPTKYKEIVEFLNNLNEEKEKIEKLLKLEQQRFEWLSDKLLSGEYIIEGDDNV